LEVVEMMAFDFFNFLMFAYVVYVIGKITMSLIDGKFTRDEFVSLLRGGALLFIVYLVAFSMKEYTAYSSINLMETRIIHQIAPNIEVDYSISGITRKEACLLEKENLYLSNTLVKSPEELRQQCMLNYVCDTGVFPSSGSNIDACLNENGYFKSLVLSLFRKEIFWVFAVILVLELVFDVFGVLNK
jgi:hypothetical protein